MGDGNSEFQLPGPSASPCWPGSWGSLLWFATRAKCPPEGFLIVSQRPWCWCQQTKTPGCLGVLLAPDAERPLSAMWLSMHWAPYTCHCRGLCGPVPSAPPAPRPGDSEARATCTSQVCSQEARQSPQVCLQEARQLF